MSNDKVRGSRAIASNKRCDCNIGIGRLDRSAQGTRLRQQVRWRNLLEIADQLEFAILLASNVAGLCDGRSIVVRCVATRVTQIAPVGATEDL